MNVSIIGSGNVATVLGRMIKKAGHSIQYIVSRDMANAETLAFEMQARAMAAISELDMNSDMYMIAVSDAAIEKINKDLWVQDKLVVHTSGSVSLNSIQNTSLNTGVLYPLQSLRKEIKHEPHIPFLIDGNNEYAKKELWGFVSSFSRNIVYANDDERMKLHTAAVLVSNFTNYLYTITEDFCQRENISFKQLVPLISEVAERLHEYSPEDMQTGPAIRKDIATIQKHLSVLEKYPEQHYLYMLFTQSISNYYT